MREFKVGDKVRCVKGSDKLKVGEEYVVDQLDWDPDLDEGFVRINNIDFWWTESRFELVKKEKTFVVYDSYHDMLNDQLSTIEEVEELILSWAEDTSRDFEDTELYLTVYEAKELPFKISKKVKWKQD